MARSEIEIFIEQNELSDEEIKQLMFVFDTILKEKQFNHSKYKGYLKIVAKLCEIEILFYDPATNITYANSEIYKKAFELIKENQ